MTETGCSACKGEDAALTAALRQALDRYCAGKGLAGLTAHAVMIALGRLAGEWQARGKQAGVSDRVLLDLDGVLVEAMVEEAAALGVDLAPIFGLDDDGDALQVLQ